MSEPTPPAGAYDLQSLSINELKNLCEHAQKRIKELEEAERKEAFRKLDEMAAQLGLSKKDLASRYAARQKPKAPRYRNPANPAETWTGRGRKPVWVEEHLARGGELDELKL